MRSVFSFRSLFIVLLAALGILVSSGPSFAQGVVVSVRYGPPELPVYEQPLCPGDGYIWTPGYWAWDGDDYYWVPGTWVLAPEVGFLWTPPWWGWGGSAFIFHPGFWGPTIGFYGGINYGFGYFGHGYEGGRWDNGHFFYNRAVNNVNVTVIHNVYNTRVENVTVNRVSYNGGQGGINARATAAEEAADRERHIGPVAAQTQHMEAARSNQQFRASVNHGRPPIAATAKPGEFSGGGNTTATSEGRYNPPAKEGNAGPAHVPTHASEIQPHEKPPAPNTGNPQLDKKYQQQQDKLYAKQQQEHQKLQQQQEKDHQKAEKQNYNAAQKQQMEQRHQQQTQQMEKRHTQEQQHLNEHQAPPPPRPTGGKTR
jgi:WXXGXW repeat (2 copies)